MEHPPQSSPSPLPSGSPVPDGSALETLLRQTFQEETARLTLPADALPRLNAHLDATSPLKRWRGSFRLAGAVAFALVLLALFTPVGRLAAAGLHTATQTIITTVKQIASGDGDSGTPPRETVATPPSTNGSGSSVAPTGGAGSPATRGTANPTGTTNGTLPAGAASSVAGTVSPIVSMPMSTATPGASTPTGTASPAPSTPTPRATDQPAASGTPVGITIATAPVATTATASSPDSPLPITPTSETIGTPIP